jgi:hypothetical protein
MEILTHGVRTGKGPVKGNTQGARVLFEGKRVRVYQADFMNEFFPSNPFLILMENDLVDVPNCAIDDLFGERRNRRLDRTR